jgi:chromosome partitioning protein
MKVVATYSIKGGVGKTATSVNLAYGFAQAGKKTLLIDLDPQGASSFYFRIRPADALKTAHFFRGRKRLLQFVRGSDYERLDLLPAKLAYRKFDRLLERIKHSKKLLAKVVRTFRSQYDIVVLDAPAGISLLSENILNAADVVLVPVIPTTLSQRTYNQLLDFFQRFRYSRKKLSPFFSMVQSGNQIHRQTMDEMLSADSRFLKAAIPQAFEVELMGVRREPVLRFADHHESAEAYDQLCQEVMHRLRAA